MVKNTCIEAGLSSINTSLLTYLKELEMASILLNLLKHPSCLHVFDMLNVLVAVSSEPAVGEKKH